MFKPFVAILTVLMTFMLVSCPQDVITGDDNTPNDIPSTNKNLTFYSVTTTNGKASQINLRWSRPSDVPGPLTSLQYIVIYNTNSAFVDQSSDITGSAITYQTWTTNINSVNINDSVVHFSKNNIYFNVGVKDLTGDITMYIPRRLGDFSGTIDDDISAKYSNVNVGISGSSLPSYDTTTDINGLYRIYAIKAGNYELTIGPFSGTMTYIFGANFVSKNPNLLGWVDASYDGTAATSYPYDFDITIHSNVTIADNTSTTLDFRLNGY